MQDALDRLGRSQHGLVSFAQLRELGVSAGSIHDWIVHRRLVPLFVGVYRLRGAPETWKQRVMAACLASGGVASHRSAARLWGLTDFEEVDVTVTRPRAPKPRGVRVHRLEDLEPRWITRREGIPVTDPVRLFVDLGAVEPLGVVAALLDRALGRRLVTVAAIRDARDAVARKGRAGCGVIRPLLDERIDLPAPACVLEARMASLLRRHGLPTPEAERVVRARDGRFVGRVDFAYPALELAIEVDGYEAHSSLGTFQADRARQNDLVALGWTVLRFTWSDVQVRAPHVAMTVERARRRLLGRLDSA
jgi:hypothetical protein